MHPRSLRNVVLAAAVVASLVFPARVDAGGAVVPLEGRSDPTTLDVRVAVATSPSGTTRWSEVTVPGYMRLLWLVPARPGATIAWASNGWMPALEEATAPRIVKPSYASSCNVKNGPERPAPWTLTASRQSPSAYTVHASAESVRSAASNAGFAIQPELDARITSLYASGWNLVALEIASSTASTTSSTLRVTDDGGAVLPLELVGSRSTKTRVTAFAIGTGVMTTKGTYVIIGNDLAWGASGSNFVTWRRDTIQAGVGEVWLRESASHAALFDGVPVAGGTSTPSVVTEYLGAAPCSTSARNAGTSNAVVGESLPASTFGCGSLDDLAVALDGLTPSSAVVTRWSGLVTSGTLAVDRPIAFDTSATQTTPVVRAGKYEATCAPPSGGSSGTPVGPGPSGGTSDEEVVVVSDGPDVVYVGDGCGGGTTTTTTYEEEEETTTTTSEDGCGGDTSTTSSSSDDGWDSSDDSSGDSCSNDTSDSSSSSSSDSCSGSSSDSSGSDDGWDTEDGMSPKTKKLSLKAHPKRTKSPVSRYALFAFALLLPLRRRARAALERR